jgi:hypothetical protein
MYVGSAHGYYSSMRKRQLPPDAELAIRGRVEPMLLNGGQTIKSLSASFLADLEDDWRKHGKKIFAVLRDKYPQAYFSGLVTLSKVIRWEDGTIGDFGHSLTPEEIMEKLERRVGPEGKRLFEKFLRDVNKLQLKQLAMLEEAEEDGEDSR